MMNKDRLRNLWENYQISAPYSNTIEYEYLFASLRTITEIVSGEEVAI